MLQDRLAQLQEQHAEQQRALAAERGARAAAVAEAAAAGEQLQNRAADGERLEQLTAQLEAAQAARCAPHRPLPRHRIAACSCSAVTSRHGCFHAWRAVLSGSSV